MFAEVPGAQISQQQAIEIARRYADGLEPWRLSDHGCANHGRVIDE